MLKIKKKIPFDTVYIEKKALEYELTQKLIKKFSKSQIFFLDHYKNLFHQKNQNFRDQKKKYSLILAVEEQNLIQKGSSFAPDFYFQNFYSNSIMLNCVYDCEYCYLQAMLPSANLVVFVNQNDFMDAAYNQMNLKEDFYLAISYDTDLLALEKILGIAEKWYDFAKTYPHCMIELRTKSSPMEFLKKTSPIKNLILAFTLSPDIIIQLYEHKTPKLEERIKSIQFALKKGFQVRICLDPLLWVQNYEEIYNQFIQKLLKSLDFNLIHSVALGTFRMNYEYGKKMKKMYPESPIIQFPFIQTQNEILYDSEKKEKLIKIFRDSLLGSFKNLNWFES